MHHTPSPLVQRRSLAWHRTRQHTCDDVITLVARRKHVPIRLLLHKSRGHPSTVQARQLAMYLSHVVRGRSLAEIGRIFGRDRTTVSYACARIEDMRDDRGFDEEVSLLEQLLASSAPPSGAGND